MSDMVVLGEGWVGGAVARLAARHPLVGSVRTIDPPFDPVLAGRDDAATDRLRGILAATSATAVVNACGRVTGDDRELEDANADFVEWLCGALDGTGVRLVHVGSASEYGDPGSADPVIESTPLRPVGAYATTKAAGSELVLAARDQGLDATVARVFNIIGHPVPGSSPIHQWLTDLRTLGPEGGTVTVWWPPTTRDFVMIDDVARALVELAVHPSPLPPVVNVCTGVGLGFGAIVEELAAALGVTATVESADRPGIPAVVGDPGLLRSLLGWAPSMSSTLLANCAVGPRDGTGGPAGANR